LITVVEDRSRPATTPEPPRYPLACLPTPLHRLPGLERALDLDGLWVKRDDLVGFGLAGNKARPLEFLLGEALAGDCDVMVTGGGSSSNFCPAVAVAAAGAGLGCELVIAGHHAETVNLRMARYCGARVTFTGQPDRASVDRALDQHAASLAAQGHRPYVMPRGGATPVGGLGFARAAAELQAQLDQVGVAPASVVLATGSGGTHAGLLAGAVSSGVAWDVHGASVSRPLTEAADRVFELALACSELLGDARPRRASVLLSDASGSGFGTPGPDEIALTKLALRSDGILLDGTYTAKSLMLAIELARSQSGPVVFWHTGGTVSAVSAFDGARVAS
jgi:1-aminocyclopropane-1-carboxylate deaminase/D-cysteine desulfhydrase-like pyridoxal-dependent ACC family enzyme